MKSRRHEWTAADSDAGTRLDVFLAARLADRSRAAIQKAIKAGHATVNESPAIPHAFLRAGDVVAFDEVDENPFGETKPPAAPLPDAEDIIVAETPDWIVLDKPAGLLVHPDANRPEPSLVDVLLKHDPGIAKVGESPERPGIVHRLDREVSGLMVVAKTQSAYDDLKRQFAQRKTRKQYLALVHGEPPHDEGDIKFRIARSTSGHRMAARPTQETGGRAAWTHYRVRERLGGAALLDIEILSGRTHQIRAHLFALGTPVAGDKLYFLRRTERAIQAPRLMLQSIGLEFNDPVSGERRAFTLEPDPAFQALADHLRLA